MFETKKKVLIFLVYTAITYAFNAWSAQEESKKNHVTRSNIEELSEWLLNRYAVYDDLDLSRKIAITATNNPHFKRKLQNGVEASKHDRRFRATLFAGNSISVLNAMGESFANMDFRDARIPHANFSGSDLTHANFMGADISHANFNGANLSHANLQGADVSHATFVNTNLAEADFAGATMEGAILFQQDQNQQQLANQGHRLHVNAVRFSPNQQTPLLVSAGNDAQICVWNPATGQQIKCWQPHQSAILSLDFSVDGHLLVSASADKTARVYATQNWQTSYVLQHDAAVTMCRFSKPEETTIACVEGGKTVKLWSAADGGFLGDFQHKHIIKDMQFSLDGSMLAFANVDGTISLCDANTGTQEGLLRGNQNGINRLAFSPKNPDLLITANSDGTLDLWDTSTKTIQQTFTGHYGCVNDVSFAHDGSTFVSAGNDWTMRLWHIHARQPLKIFWGHTQMVNAAAVSPDPKNPSVASASADHTVRVYNITTTNNDMSRTTIETAWTLGKGAPKLLLQGANFALTIGLSLTQKQWILHWGGTVESDNFENDDKKEEWDDNQQLHHKPKTSSSKKNSPLNLFKRKKSKTPSPKENEQKNTTPPLYETQQQTNADNDDECIVM